MPLPQSGRGGRRRRSRGGRKSAEERSRSSCPEEELEAVSALTWRKGTLSGLQSKPVAPPWQPSGGCLTLSVRSRVWERLRRDWGYSFSVRLDLQGCFHTYPDVGGPFQNLEEADKAINRYLEARRDPKMCLEEGPVAFSMEGAVRQHLYWPDGTIRKRTRSYLAKKGSDRTRKIVQALVDKYNEDHNLLKDDAHELKDVLHCQSICENQNWYYHLNFTTYKGAGPNNCKMENLIFAEVKCMAQEQHKELLISCFCTVNDSGQHCYGCTKNGNPDMMHPDSSVEYIAGHLDVCLPFGRAGSVKWSDSEEDDAKYVKAKEAKLRRMYKFLDNPDTIKRLFTLPPGVTIVNKDD